MISTIQLPDRRTLTVFQHAERIPEQIGSPVVSNLFHYGKTEYSLDGKTITEKDAKKLLE